METHPLKPGDTCPRCDGQFKPARVPTNAQYTKAFDRENPGSLPDGADTASPEFRAEHGNLFRCGDCGYSTRFTPDQVKTAEADTKGRDGADAAQTHDAPAASSTVSH